MDRSELVAVDGELQPVKVPALSSISLTQTPESTTETTAQVGEHTIETPFYCVTYAEDGHVTSLYDLRLERELFTEAGGNVLTVYEDRPLDFNNWNIDADYPQKATVLQADALDLTANTANYVDLTTTYHYGQSSLKQVMRLYAKDPRIDFITDIDWHQHEELLRTAFNTKCWQTMRALIFNMGMCCGQLMTTLAGIKPNLKLSRINGQISLNQITASPCSIMRNMAIASKVNSCR